MQALARNAEAAIGHWFERPRRKPLVIRGARQVGKSWLVRSAARSLDLRLIEIDLERHPELNEVFASLDVDRILLELEATTGASAQHPGTLLFLDEIQAAPSALAALRYFFEQRPEIAVIAAGSLLEALLRTHEFSMPVGRIEYLHLGPMTMGEFLGALGEEHLATTLSGWQPDEPFPEAAHRKLIERQRQFMLVGGMPEAVAVFADTRELAEVADVHRSIVSTYKDDFSKYARTSSTLVRLRTVLDYVPSALGRKVKYAHISRDDPARSLRSALDLLALARVVWRVHHSSCSGLPLEATLDPHVYKCLFLDVGLAARISGVDWTTLTRWDRRGLVDEGGLAEQFIGQHLLYARGLADEPSLCYWLREGRANNAEVDYVISRARRVVPVEVKAGSAGSLKSVHRFLARRLDGIERSRIALRFDLNPPSIADYEHAFSDGSGITVSYRMLSLPLYMVEQAGRVLDEI